MQNHPGLAAVLSILLPGLGQVYNGKAASAAKFFVLYIICLMFFIFGGEAIVVIFGLVAFGVAVASAVNAYKGK